MADNKKSTVLFWGMTLDTTGFKKGLATAKKELKKASEEFKTQLADVAKIGAGIGAVGAGIAVGLGAITKKSVEAINAQNILAGSIGTTQSKIAGLELASNKWGVETKMVLDKMKEKGGFNKFVEMSEQVKGAGNAQAQLNTAIKLFGNEGAKILPILQLGKSGLADMEREALKLGLALDPVKVQKSVLAWEQFENFTLRMKGLGNTIATSMAEPFAKVFGSINGFLETFDKDISLFFEGLGEKITGVIDWGLKQFSEFGIPAINSFINFANEIGSAFSNIFDFLSGGADSTFGTIKGWLNTMLDFMATFQDSIAYGVTNAVRSAISGTFMAIKGFSNFMLDTAMTIAAAFNMDSLVESIADAQVDFGIKINKMSSDFQKPFINMMQEFEDSMTQTLIDRDEKDTRQQTKFNKFIADIQSNFDDAEKGITKDVKKPADKPTDKPTDKQSPLNQFASTLIRGSAEEFKARNTAQEKLLKESEKQTKELQKLNNNRMKMVIV